MSTSLRGVFATDAGMLALWDRQNFQAITDYETWEPELLEDEDIQRHILAGAYVPLYIHSDGAFGCEVRVGDTSAPAVLSTREQEYRFMTSQPYLFRSPGEAYLSGIEHVEGEPGQSVGRVTVAPGNYAVTVSMLEWDKEPGAKGEDGQPVADALPDFLVLLNLVTGQEEFRTKVDTFDEPSA